ncbi:MULTISPECIES: flagellar hook-basal body complex protein FliE [Methylobacterium]|jgi:flagellar hook-basal body complex protein FliE|uniref:Flagellar hook-basal body complex protein FliE n=3 Tax=Methylobacteriaceae TaxID=119045 RepID=A0A0C6FHA0_9HYPH|nr:MULTISPECIES: flagellar hook-basal body complex protein FliE [Methylobacterium]MBK3396290.1 flagellar hook-basal body complex protein FliE [Methylobacterium ajmalii]MBK3412243.1 flagellar hook-basal body complex protein FliE [Methylobacterium ajmalii]MBK3420973.1 flagellar hook-basal body complex protein FliE [Methylobacterium ajmalii]MBZ6415157.1 flagellar hook-basal body complex protein FliE [Methylobacterium sp.]SFF59583.1 flagellar hook-basal body complex protein FliE [Methylobacterium 
MIEALTLSAFDRAAASARPEAAASVQRAMLPPVTGAVPGADAAAPADFGQIMASFATGVRDQLRAGEAASIAGIQGKASTQQVVEAVMSAEQSLQTAVAIRDKVVAAYLELSRMAI